MTPNLNRHELWPGKINIEKDLKTEKWNYIGK